MINDRVKLLIRCVCSGETEEAYRLICAILEKDVDKGDYNFRENMLFKLDRIEKNKVFKELPSGLQGLVLASSPESYSDSKFLLRKSERELVEKLLATYKVSSKLSSMGIYYLPSLILYGQSGCGKTELAKYIAHKANLPYLYVNFSRLVDKYLGETQKNVSNIFNFTHSTPCVLCLDEIDTIGLERGQSDDIGEMNRIVISIMQEMDRLPNNVIIIGTTNRFDMLDKALVRRFTLKHEVTPLGLEESKRLAIKFFDYAGIKPPNMHEWYVDEIVHKSNCGLTPAHKIVESCTEYIVNRLIKEQEKKV